jgi:hypothetical protein
LHSTLGRQEGKRERRKHFCDLLVLAHQLRCPPREVERAVSACKAKSVDSHGCQCARRKYRQRTPSFPPSFPPSTPPPPFFPFPALPIALCYSHRGLRPSEVVDGEGELLLECRLLPETQPAHTRIHEPDGGKERKKSGCGSVERSALLSYSNISPLFSLPSSTSSIATSRTQICAPRH